VIYKVILVFIGSGLGGVLRYALSGVVQNWWGPSFPLGTLIVNASGCLAMGFLAAMMGGGGPILVREEHRVAILIGILGGYTTFSAFGRETMALVADGEWLFAALNVILSNFLGLLAVWAGAAISMKLYGPGAP
jgi:CrcB protein